MEFSLLKKCTNPIGVQAIFVYGYWRLKISLPQLFGNCLSKHGENSHVTSL